MARLTQLSKSKGQRVKGEYLCKYPITDEQDKQQSLSPCPTRSFILMLQDGTMRLLGMLMGLNTVVCTRLSLSCAVAASFPSPSLTTISWVKWSLFIFLAAFLVWKAFLQRSNKPVNIRAVGGCIATTSYNWIECSSVWILIEQPLWLACCLSTHMHTHTHKECNSSLY